MIKIQIELHADGKITTEAWRENQDPTAVDLVTIVGALETAKGAMLAGRWGVLDAEKKRQLGYTNFMNKEYEAAREEAEGKSAALPNEETK